MRIPYVPAALLIVPFLAACGSGTTLMGTCDPPCAANTTCDSTTNTCLPGNVIIDMSVSNPVDLSSPGGCLPACKNPTPYCNMTHQCVVCLTDDQCAFGFVCRTTGAGATCVPGCADSSRCGQNDGGA